MDGGADPAVRRTNPYPRSGPVRGLLLRAKRLPAFMVSGRGLVHSKWVRAWGDFPPKGTCLWCRQPCRRARNWHQDCVTAYLVAKGQVRYPGTTKRIVASRTCQECGCDLRAKHPIERRREKGSLITRYSNVVPGEVDHRYPLWRAAIDHQNGVRGWWKAWTVGNLQIICRDCHLAKCSTEAAERAAINREKR